MWGTGPAPCPQGEPKWRVQRSGLIIPCAAAIHFLLNSLETAVPDLCPDFAVTEERSTHFPSRTFRDLNPVHAFNIEAGLVATFCLTVPIAVANLLAVATVFPTQPA